MYYKLQCVCYQVGPCTDLWVVLDRNNGCKYVLYSFVNVVNHLLAMDVSIIEGYMKFPLCAV